MVDFEKLLDDKHKNISKKAPFHIICVPAIRIYARDLESKYENLSTPKHPCRRIRYVSFICIDKKISPDLWGKFSSSYFVHIISGGSTGYESVTLPDDYVEGVSDTHNYFDTMFNNGWYACAGTYQRWDRIWISPEHSKYLIQSARRIFKDKLASGSIKRL